MLARMQKTAFSLGKKHMLNLNTKVQGRKDKILFCFLPILIFFEPLSEFSGGKIHYLLNRIFFFSVKL